MTSWCPIWELYRIDWDSRKICSYVFSFGGEYCIPENILRAWIKSPLHKQAEVGTVDRTANYNRQTSISFNLFEMWSGGRRKDFHGKIRIPIKGNISTSHKEYKVKKSEETYDVPKASNLYYGGDGTAKIKKNPSHRVCIFCE